MTRYDLRIVEELKNGGVTVAISLAPEDLGTGVAPAEAVICAER